MGQSLIPPPGVRENWLCQKIVAELARDEQIDAAKIRVDVQNGKVTLSGEVPSAAAQSSANWITTAIPEVTDVINHLKVARPETLTMPAAEKKE